MPHQTHWSTKDGNLPKREFEGETLTSDTCPNFSGVTFTQGAYFKGTVFDCFADFSNAVFEGGDVDFTDAVFLQGVSFKGAQFGFPYQRDFGEWEIWFKERNGEYFLKRRKQGEKKVPEELGCIWKEGYEKEFPECWGMEESLQGLTDSFDRFKKNPGTVSFENCRFGELDLKIFTTEEFKCVRQGNPEIGKKVLAPNFSPENLSETEKTEVMFLLARHLDRSRVLDGLLPPKNVHVDFKRAQFRNRSYVNFSKSLFLNRGEVDFDSSSWSNSGAVLFGSAVWSNGGTVWFRFASWSNGGNVVFSSASWSNDKDVRFNSASWSNGWDVRFNSAEWSNGGAVWFNSAKWSNGGDVRFNSAVWSNGGNVSFVDTSFKNKRDIELSQLILANRGNGSFKGIRFHEEAEVRFNECLFLPTGDLSFAGAHFPEKGSTMFQRCYFGRTPKVDFTGALFRHTMFEGGEIEWLRSDKRTDPAFEALRDRLETILASLPDDLKGRIEAFSLQPQQPTPVFDPETRVLWKDLTTESAKHLTLRRVNLSHSIFDGMTLSHIQLNAPGWLEKEGRRMLMVEAENRSVRKRPWVNHLLKKILGNSLIKKRLHKKQKEVNRFKKWFKRIVFYWTLGKTSHETLRDIEDQYTQLKNNLERQGNYLHAGDFHYGEQEVRREIIWHKWKTERRLSSLWDGGLGLLYKFLSGYGERSLQAIGIMLAVLAMFSWILYLAGDYGYWESMVRLITPFSWRADLAPGKSLSLTDHFFLIPFQIILLAIQVPLLVMAVRRRFKR